jgi:hypothetical protein
MVLKSSVFERLADQMGLSWYRFVGVVVVLLALSIVGVAYLDGILAEFFSAGHWRLLLSYPALIVYMLAIVPPMDRASDRTLAAFRTLIAMDDESFDQLLDEITAPPRGQWIVFGVGAAIGFLGILQAVAEGFSWVVLYWVFANSLTVGLLTWSIQAALSSSRSIAALYHQPLNIDIFDLRAFGPIGRQSLINALSFFGGAAISLFFVAGGVNSFEVGTWFFYGILVLVSALAFILPMRQTHRVLAAAKEEELVQVRHNIVAAYRSLEKLPADSRDLGILPTKLNLWKEYEARVKATKTWPFDLGMLRTFFLSVFTPIGISLAQRLISRLFNL